MKIVLVVLSLLLAVSTSTAYASETRCQAILELQPKVEEIHSFITNIKSYDADQYSEKLNQLNNDTHAIADKVLGCDDYSDSIIAQMHGAIAKLMQNQSTYLAN